MEIARAYGVLYRALHAALLSDASIQTRLAGVMFAVQQMETHRIPDEQISLRFAQWIHEAGQRTWDDRSLALVLTDEEASSYLEQALSLFGAIAIVYGQQQSEPCIPHSLTDQLGEDRFEHAD
jgi:hypothetical protein